MQWSVNLTKAFWMEYTRDLIFLDGNHHGGINKGDFNLLFIAPLCCPSRSLYDSWCDCEKNPDRDILKEQELLVKKYISYTEIAKRRIEGQSESSLKSNVQGYTDILVSFLNPGDKTYCQKSGSNTHSSYVNYFTDCSGWEDERVLNILELYTKIFDGIFMHHRDAFKCSIQRLQEKCMSNYELLKGRYSKLPEPPSFITFPIEDEEMSRVSAKLLLFSLLYYSSEKNKGCQYKQVLGLCGLSDEAVVEKAEEKFSVPSSLFYELCLDSMKSEKSWTIEKLRMLDGVLQKNRGTDIPVELTYLLIEKCKGLVTTLYQEERFDCLKELKTIQSRYERMIFENSVNVVKAE